MMLSQSMSLHAMRIMLLAALIFSSPDAARADDAKTSPLPNPPTLLHSPSNPLVALRVRRSGRLAA